MKLYKLIEQDWTTYRKSMKWKIGKTNKVKKCKNPILCSPDVIHAYRNINLALLLNPIHANIDNPIILESEGDVVIEDYGKCGVFGLTPIKEKRLPKWYKNIEIRKDVLAMFAILCAESVLHIFEEKYPDDDRPRKAIEVAKNYLKYKTKATIDVIAYANARAAIIDVVAAYTATIDRDARAATIDVAAAAYAAARAVVEAATIDRDARAATIDVAAYVADAAYASYAAAAATIMTIDFKKLADKAVKEIMKNYPDVIK